MGLKYLKNVVTLSFDENKCTDCGMCVKVCPHGVFDLAKSKLTVKQKDSCMECGACALNCPAEALGVKAGVGCALAYIMGWISKSEPNCGCGKGCS